jgi:DNA (cytosine-5)-methyltransferase 1
MFNPAKRDRHLYWTNFNLPNKLSDRTNSGQLNHVSVMQDLVDFHQYDFRKYKGGQRMLKIARNLVDYEAGRTIFETALGIIRKQDITQTELFK